MNSAADRVRALLTKVILENDNAAKHEIEAIVRKLEGLIDRARPFMDHRIGWCKYWNIWNIKNETCTCGYTALLVELEDGGNKE